jgi:hypothetical protein
MHQNAIAKKETLDIKNQDEKAASMITNACSLQKKKNVCT